MRLFTRLASLPLAVLVALTMIGPVAAGDGALPDAQVRRAGGPQLGNNVFSLDGSGQTAGGHKQRRYLDGAVRWFYAYVYNDGVSTGTFVIGASESISVATARPTSIAPYLVQYFSPSGVDITASVLSNSYATPPLAFGGRYGIKVKVTVGEGAPHGSEIGVLVSMSLQSEPGNKDVVGIRMRRK